jgi:hypothetical protein
MRGAMKYLMNDELRERQYLDPDTAATMKREFTEALETAEKIFSTNAFKKYDPGKASYDTRFSEPLWDAVLVGLSNLVHHTRTGSAMRKRIDLLGKAVDIEAAFQGLFERPEWLTALRQSKRVNVEARISLFEEAVKACTVG